MESKDYARIKNMLSKELEDVTNGGKPGMAEIEIIDKLTHSIASIDKIMAMEDGEGDYSGRYYANGSYGHNRSYDDGGYSGARHYVRGHYSRGDMMDKLREMMEDSSEADREPLRRAYDQLKNRM